jgi:hypothetical protein
MGRVVQGTSCPRGELSMGQIVHGVSCPCGELSMRQNFNGQNFPGTNCHGASNHGGSCDGVHCPAILPVATKEYEEIVEGKATCLRQRMTPKPRFL